MRLTARKAMLTVAVLVAAAAVGVAHEDRPLVHVSGGLVRGLKSTTYNVTYLEFLGIPFGTPPLDQLRFKDPLPAEPWEGELDASEYPPFCVQVTSSGQEDCLYLSVYTPEDALTVGCRHHSHQYPVMVYIQGFGFFSGGNFFYNGIQELVSRGLIVVVIQYRLGLIGFLSTEDDAAPGNQGLKDQTLALQWVQENIAAFGGDPTKVTIFGQGAGSVSVHFQMLAPSAAGLFSGAIMESGDASMPWATGRDFLATAQAIAERFNCPTLPTDELVTCLQGVEAHLLNSLFYDTFDWVHKPYRVAPRVDGDFILDEPVTLMQQGLFHHVPTIIGVNKDEMSKESVEMYANTSIIDSLLGNFNVNGPISLLLFPDEDPVNTATTTYTRYLGEIDITTEDADNLTKMYTDRYYHIPHDWTTQLMSASSVVYTYELNHRGEHSNIDGYLENGLDLPQAENDVAHRDNEQYYLYPGYARLNRTDDKLLGHYFTTMWSNFAKYRNPTPDDSLGFTWEMTEPTMLPHLTIVPQPYMETDQRTEARAFWESLPLRINDLLNQLGN